MQAGHVGGEGEHDAAVGVRAKSGAAEVAHGDGRLGERADDVLDLKFRNARRPGEGDVRDRTAGDDVASERARAQVGFEGGKRGWGEGEVLVGDLSADAKLSDGGVAGEEVTELFREREHR